MNYEAIVMGVSSGGMSAMKVMFSLLPKSFNTPIIMVQHIGVYSDNQWIKILNETCLLIIRQLCHFYFLLFWINKLINGENIKSGQYEHFFYPYFQFITK